MTIEAMTVYDAWVGLLKEVMTYGVEASPRGLKVRERLGTQVVIQDFLQNIIVHPRRDLNYRFMVAEWLWILAGRNDLQTLTRYNKQLERFSDDGVTLWGAYGPRLYFQWNYLVNSITDDPDTRQAVASIWDRRPPKTKDVPCTIACQFLLRQGKLHAIWTMRSQDLWLGFPYDFYSFSQIANALAGHLSVEPGSLCLNVGSSHVYETNYDAVEEVLKTADNGYTLPSPALDVWPQANAILDLAAELTEGQQPMFTSSFEVEYANILASSGKLEAIRRLSNLQEKIR